MSKLWTFGDSFTFGDGCNPYDDYYKQYPEKVSFKWNQLVANHYNYELKDFSKNGAPNSWILRQLVNNIDKIDEGDLVSINFTGPFRFEIPNPNQTDDLQPVLSQIINEENPLFEEFAPNSNENTAIYNYIKYIYLMDIYKNDKKVTEGYQLIDRFIQRQFDSICRLFKKNNIRFVKWTWDTPGFIQRFENISQCTNDKIDNFHPSWKGHKDISKWIIRSFENNINRINNLL